MPSGRFSAYFANCFWMMLPPLAISGLLADSLPPVFQPTLFWHDIAAVIGWTETVTRVLVTGLPMLMPMSALGSRQRWGWAIYGVGLIAYGLAWWPLIAAPDSVWSLSLAGFAAPAYTPVLWLAGIGLVGMDKSTKRSRWINWSYAAAATIFICSHNLHTLLIYARHIAT